MSSKVVGFRYTKDKILALTGDIDEHPINVSLNSLSCDHIEHEEAYTNNKGGDLALQQNASNNFLTSSEEASVGTAVPVQPQADTKEPIQSRKTAQFTSYTPQQRIKQVQKNEQTNLCISALPQNFEKGADKLQDLNGLACSGFLKNYKTIEDGKLEMTNEELLKKQKQVLGFLIKQFGSMLFSGKSVMNISLPITIFEPRTLLEKVADSFSFAPHFLEKAGRTNDTLEQFKLALTYFVSSLSGDLNPQKPCTPGIGETFQGIVGGCPVYVEQISSQPPLAAFQVLGKNFTAEGNSELQASILINSVKCRKIGDYKIMFKNTGSVIFVQFPDGIMSGTAFGRRVWQFSRKLQVYDPTNCYYAELDFEKSEPTKKRREILGYFSNGIYKTTEKFMDKATQDFQKAKDAEIKFKEKDHSLIKLCDFEGSWFDFLNINGQNYWKFGNIWPYEVQCFDNPLPSDSNFRLDLLYLQNDNEEKAQECKMLLEEHQRKDKKLKDSNRSKRK